MKLTGNQAQRCKGAETLWGGEMISQNISNNNVKIVFKTFLEDYKPTVKHL